MIGILYKIEEMIRNKHRKKNRGAPETVPSGYGCLFEWLHTMEDSVDTGLPLLVTMPLLYTLNQEAYLKRYLEDGHLSIDNNGATERALKKLCSGDAATGCLPKSVLVPVPGYSITETALLNHLEPYAYLTYILMNSENGLFLKRKS